MLYWLPTSRKIYYVLINQLFIINALPSMVKLILPLILGQLLLTITVNVCKFYRNRKVVF
jgi:hypothetical protein